MIWGPVRVQPATRMAGPLPVHRRMGEWIVTAICAYSLVLCSYQAVLAQGTADIMHRARGIDAEDILLTVFHETLTAGNAGDWATVRKTIRKIDGQMDRHQKSFGIDVRSKLDQSVHEENLSETLKSLAKVVYLEMKAQFKIIADGRMEDLLDSKSRLDKAKLYYTTVLAGNVKRKDPKRHTDIEDQFVHAEAALGNPGVFIHLPSMKPDLNKFIQATKKIEQDIVSVYTFF